MANQINPVTFRFPFDIEGKAHESVVSAIRYCFSGLLDLNQAIPHLKSQVDSTAATANSSSSSTAGVSSFNSETGDVIYFPQLGTVNNQLGSAGYLTQQSDNGAKIVVGDSSAVAITLNNGVTAPWFAIIDNDSGSVASLTPGSGSLFGETSIQPGGFGIVHFDGTDFWCGATEVPPQDTPLVTHEWLNSYDADTGVFGQSQPAFSDISGQITTSQLPASGLSVTITTAKLTVGGSNGSMTFLNGILTASTPAT